MKILNFADTVINAEKLLKFEKTEYEVDVEETAPLFANQNNSKMIYCITFHYGETHLDRFDDVVSQTHHEEFSNKDKRDESFTNIVKYLRG